MTKEYSLVKNEKTGTIELTFKNAFTFKEGMCEEVIFIDSEGNELIIASDHSPDCCEWNYICGSNLDETLITEMESNVLVIEFIDEYGIRINGNNIPCYSDQNGYYSSYVTLEFYYSSKDGSVNEIIYSTEMDCLVRD